MRAIKRAERNGDYARACALLIRRDTRRATLDHYSDAITVAAYIPGVAIFAYLAYGLFFV